MALTLSPSHANPSSDQAAPGPAATPTSSITPHPMPQQQQPPPPSPARSAQSEDICSNPFLDAFFAVDKDNSETITSEELSDYMSNSQFENNFGEKWMKLFDEDADGTITLEEYCNVLGLNPKQARIYRSKKLRAACLREGRLPEDVTCISASMELETQLDVLEVFRDAQRRGQQARDIAAYMKTQLDQQFGRLWHVVLLTGQYWASYSHEPGMALFFKSDKFIVMVWRTPGI